MRKNVKMFLFFGNACKAMAALFSICTRSCGDMVHFFDVGQIFFNATSKKDLNTMLDTLSDHATLICTVW